MLNVWHKRAGTVIPQHDQLQPGEISAKLNKCSKNEVCVKARSSSASIVVTGEDSTLELGSLPSSLIEKEWDQDFPPLHLLGLKPCFTLMVQFHWSRSHKGDNSFPQIMSNCPLSTLILNLHLQFLIYIISRHTEFTASPSSIFAIFYSPIKNTHWYFQLTEFPYTKHKRGHGNSYIESIYTCFSKWILW